MNLEKVLVTGGAGFIGSHLADRLLAKDFDVLVLNDLSSGSMQKIEGHLGDSGLSFLKTDVRDFGKVKEATRDVDAVFHGATIIASQLNHSSYPRPTYTRQVYPRPTSLHHASTRQRKHFYYPQRVFGSHPSTLSHRSCQESFLER